MNYPRKNNKKIKKAILELFLFAALCSIPGVFSLLSTAARGEVLVVGKWGRDLYFPAGIRIGNQWTVRDQTLTEFILGKTILSPEPSKDPNIPRVALFNFTLFEWRVSDVELVSRRTWLKNEWEILILGCSICLGNILLPEVDWGGKAEHSHPSHSLTHVWSLLSLQA